MTRLAVTFETWIPTTAALKLDGNDINIAVVVKTPRLLVNIDTKNFLTVNLPHCRNL